MSWKQPIPTSVLSDFGDDHLSRLIYVECLLRASNVDKSRQFAGVLHFLKRGQCVIGENELGVIFNRNRKSVHASLQRLIKVHNKLDIRATPKGTIVSILNYDEIVSMDNRPDIKTVNKVTTEGQQRGTNKSDKSKESAKETDHATELITLFNECFSRQYRVTSNRRKHIQARLGVFTAEQLGEAIKKLSQDPFYRGTSGHGTWAASPDYLFKSDENVDKALNMTSQQTIQSEYMSVDEALRRQDANN